MATQELALGITPNGWVDTYPHNDLESACTQACCEPEAYPQPYRWPCQGDGCTASLLKPGECIVCSPPAATSLA